MVGDDMKFTAKEISEYQTLHETLLGGKVSEDEARKGLAMLVRQLEAVYRPITATQLDKHMNRNNHDTQNDSPQA